MITDEMITKIEKAFGFPLYDWQKEYLLRKREDIIGGRYNGKTFIYCIKLLLSDGKPIINGFDLGRYADEWKGTYYRPWFDTYCMEINDVLVKEGFKTRIK